MSMSAAETLPPEAAARDRRPPIRRRRYQARPSSRRPMHQVPRDRPIHFRLKPQRPQTVAGLFPVRKPRSADPFSNHRSMRRDLPTGTAPAVIQTRYDRRRLGAAAAAGARLGRSASTTMVPSAGRRRRPSRPATAAGRNVDLQPARRRALRASPSHRPQPILRAGLHAAPATSPCRLQHSRRHIRPSPHGTTPHRATVLLPPIPPTALSRASRWISSGRPNGGQGFYCLPARRQAGPWPRSPRPATCSVIQSP